MKQLTIIGNIGKDAEIKSGNGSKFVSFTVAVNERYKDAQGVLVEKTDWISVTTRQESLAPYLKKGTMVFVQGRMETQIFKSQQDQSWKVGINLHADIIRLLSSKKDDSQPAPQGAAPQPVAAPAQRQPIPQTAFSGNESEEDNALPF